MTVGGDEATASHANAKLLVDVLSDAESGDTNRFWRYG